MSDFSRPEIVLTITFTSSSFRSSVTNGLMMLNSTAWMNSCETGCHCLVEPCTRICPSSVVYQGSMGRLHCGFLICFCCLGWCKLDFLHVAYVIIDTLRFALVFERYPSVVLDVDS